MGTSLADRETKPDEPLAEKGTPKHRPARSGQPPGEIESNATCGLADLGLEIWHHG